MSSTYSASSQIVASARANGWYFIPCDEAARTTMLPYGAWGCVKPGRRVMIRKRKDGGLSQAWLTYRVSDGSNCDYYGPRNRDKLRTVLRFLEGLVSEQSVVSAVD